MGSRSCALAVSHAIVSYGEGVCFIPVIVGATKARLFDSLAKLIKSNNTLSHTSMCKSTTFKKQKKKGSILHACFAEKCHECLSLMGVLALVPKKRYS